MARDPRLYRRAGRRQPQAQVARGTTTTASIEETAGDERAGDRAPHLPMRGLRALRLR